MTYEVSVTDKASGQLFEAGQWWAERRSVEQAKRWFDGFVSAIDSLQDNPERCALARENDDLPMTIRELHYGLVPNQPIERSLLFGLTALLSMRFDTSRSAMSRLTIFY